MTNNNASSIRKTVHYNGHVQGVGFRYTTFTVSSKFHIKGFVRNLHDGRVELVAEGDCRNVDAFLKAVSDAMDGCISDSTVYEAPPTNEFHGFDIRR